MRPVSTKFLDSLRGTHRGSVQAFVVAAGQSGVSPTGTELTVISGDVQLDATADIRSTLDITISGEFPDNASDDFTPYGNEIFVRRGIAFGGGGFEWVSLGYFRIKSTEQDDAPNGPLRIAAQDRMAGIVEARLLGPVQFASTDTYGTVVNTLVQEVFPWATIEWDDLTNTDALGRSVIAEEDRYAFLDELVTSRGKIWYWDHRGILVIKDVPTQDDPVWEVNAGEDGVLIALSRDLSREGVYNAVVATGEALDTETPPRAVAVDDNVDSPTYWFGDFGKVPRFYNSPFITTDAQALTTAQSLLRQKLGLPYNVNFNVIPNPALEPWDPVAVNLTGTRNKVTSVPLLVDTFQRTVVDSWGTSDNGETWTMGTAAYFDVTGTVATISIPSTNVASYAVISGMNQTDVDGLLTVSVPNAATGASIIVGGVTRYSNTGGLNFYSFSIEFNVSGTVTAKLRKYVAGVFTELASNNPIPGLTYTAGQHWHVRFRNYGSVLRMRVWLDGQSEPTNWHLETVDTSLSTGSVGVWAWRQSTNTNTGAQQQVHDLTVNSYQAHIPGAEIHVIEKITIPLTMDQAMSADTREQTLVVLGEV